MSIQIKTLVLSGNGVNCERETAQACRLAGADMVEVISIWELVANSSYLDGAHLLCLPGGFADGDDLGAAQAAANRIKYSRSESKAPIIEALETFVKRGKAIIGICNGFQLLVKLGLLPIPNLERRVSLTFNRSGRFEDRWVHLLSDSASPCIFTRGIEHLEVPVRHGEGRLVVRDEEVAQYIETNHLVPLRYADPNTGMATDVYPHNPNGAWSQAAALCDITGRVFGLMPHPEAFLHRTNHPRWTRQPLSEEGQGVALFRNAIDQLRMSPP